MTDEERQKLIARFKSHEVVMWTDIDLAVDEIERLAALVQSNAGPHIWHNTEGGFKEIVARDTTAIYDNNPQLRLVEEIFDFDRKPIGFRVYDAQSDAEPWRLSEEAKRQLAEIDRATVRQGDPRMNAVIGLQSDAEPQHPLGPDGKPMMDWYYDDEGVCRPLPSTLHSYIDAAVKAGLATRNPAPDAAAGGPTPFKTVTIGGVAPPRPDEERQKLALKLRAARPGYPPGELCVKAANEIERLMKEKEDLRSACCNYLKQAEAGLDELKANLREDAWWLNPTPTR